VTAPTATRRGPAERSLPQRVPAKETLQLAQTTTHTLNNLIIPVVFDGQTRVIAAFLLRPGGMPIETPHYCDQVSLEKFKEAISKECLRDPPFRIRAQNSVGKHRVVRNDEQLKTSLICWVCLKHSGSGELPADYFTVNQACTGRVRT